ncbi:hypothetical protein KAW80_04025 [Candidatus Babeliales bacterium]|nr:hypothetical protein [Candidatus Babeliales bacterium]
MFKFKKLLLSILFSFSFGNISYNSNMYCGELLWRIDPKKFDDFGEYRDWAFFVVRYLDKEKKRIKPDKTILEGFRNIIVPKLNEGEDCAITICRLYLLNKFLTHLSEIVASYLGRQIIRSEGQVINIEALRKRMIELHRLLMMINNTLKSEEDSVLWDGRISDYSYLN